MGAGSFVGAGTTAAALTLSLLFAAAAGQAARDCSSMVDLNHFADAVTAVCCDDESDGCDDDGIPAHCDADCAPTILEMQEACGSVLLAWDRFLGPLKDNVDAVAAACPANIIPDPTACATMAQFSD